MISKSFGYLLTGTCIFNVKNDISVHINKDQFRLNMQYINPMLLGGKQLTEAFVMKLSYRHFWLLSQIVRLLSQFCTILGDALVRNRAFMGANRIGFPIFIWLYLFLSLFLLLAGIMLSHLSLLNEIDMFKYSILILWTYYFFSL